MAKSGINIKLSHKGRLHEKLGVPQGKPIPAGKLDKALNSDSPALRKEANFAKNAKGFSHKPQTTTAGREVERRLNAKDKR